MSKRNKIDVSNKENESIIQRYNRPTAADNSKMNHVAWLKPNLWTKCMLRSTK